MKTITFALQKGGTGKTSVSVSVALELAKKHKVIFIDADPQGNASD
ncbi:MAG: ParA family protein, partial [Treponema sp.]|nr:ParA family protein [Treponema sp.]